MSYTVLARRYRSRSFDEIIGQDPIARTLRNAVESGRTAHAYLFCGTRGVGKTSMARIFAAALNVDPGLEQAEQIADAILRGDDLDVIEIDGASNRGIQEAKELIAGAGLSPTRCPYKIYIIDEVHMLTREAFNALLKTMEEPPEHVKFILCTTEPHKVPATIQSRCQRFDFRPLPAARIAEQLRTILEQESVEADDAVVATVARLGRGSMRDALSLLDRLLASGETHLTSDLLEQMLGVADQTLVAGLMQAIVGGDAGEALRRAESLLAGGTNIDQALELLTEYLRTMLVVRTCGVDSDLLEVSAEARESAAAQAEDYDPPALVHMIALCDAVARNVRGSSTARALFDAAIVRLCLSEQLADIAGLLRGDQAPPPTRKKKVGRRHEVSPASASESARPEETSRPGRAEPRAVERPSSAPLPEASPPKAEPPKGEPPTGHETSAVPDERLWPSVLEYAVRSHVDQTIVEGLRLIDFDGTTLRLSVAETGAEYARFLSGQVPRLTELVRHATGRRVRIELETPTRSGQRASVPERLLAEARERPAVRQAVELFEAEIFDVQSVDTEASGSGEPAGEQRDA